MLRNSIQLKNALFVMHEMISSPFIEICLLHLVNQTRISLGKSKYWALFLRPFMTSSHLYTAPLSSCKILVTTYASGTISLVINQSTLSADFLSWEGIGVKFGWWHNLLGYLSVFEWFSVGHQPKFTLTRFQRKMCLLINWAPVDFQQVIGQT